MRNSETYPKLSKHQGTSTPTKITMQKNVGFPWFPSSQPPIARPTASPSKRTDGLHFLQLFSTKLFCCTALPLHLHLQGLAAKRQKARDQEENSNNRSSNNRKNNNTTNNLHQIAMIQYDKAARISETPIDLNLEAPPQLWPLTAFRRPRPPQIHEVVGGWIDGCWLVDVGGWHRKLPFPV